MPLTLVWGPFVPTPPAAPPDILGIAEEEVSASEWAISWDVSPASQGRVHWDTDSGSVVGDYANATTLEEGYLTYHRQTIEGLPAGTTIYYRIWGKDADGNEVTSDEGTFTTAGAPAAFTTTYGPAVYADTLFNEYIGGSQSLQLAYRFKAEHSAVPASVRVYTIVYNSGGYSAGDGGKVRARLYAVDGSGMPTGSPLATSTTFTPGNPPSTDFPVLSWAGAPSLVAGTRYAIVFDNPHSSPASNYCSLDQLCNMASPAPNPYQPKWPDADMAFLVKAGSGSWGLRSPVPQFTPIFDLAYSGGAHQGCGYMETSNGSWYAYIGGSSMARERFTVSGGSRTVTGVGCGLTRISGSGALSVRLETGAGSEIETVTFASSSIPIKTGDGEGRGSITTVYADFATSHVLSNGSTYNVRLSAPSGTTYRINSLRKGGAYGFSSSTYFSDGYGQKTTNSGSTWTGVHTSGGDWTGIEDIAVTLGVA